MGKLKNRVIIIFSIISILVLTIFGINFYRINSLYPTPEKIYQNSDGELLLGDYCVRLLNYEKTDIRNIMLQFPESDYFSDESQLDYDTIWYLVELEYENVTQEESAMEIWYTTISNGTTTNGMDLFAFYAINGEDVYPVVSANPGERLKLILPFSLPKDDIDYSESVEILFSLYPEIISIILE